jgi:uncharacterized protein
MAAMDPAAVQALIAASPLTAKYAVAVDRQSAHEMITARIQAAQAAAAAKAAEEATQHAPSAPGAPGAPGAPARGGQGPRRRGGRRGAAPAERGGVGGIVQVGEKFATSRSGQALIRSVLGTLFKAR